MQPIEALYALQALEQRVTAIEREMDDVPPLVQAAALRRAQEADSEARDQLADTVRREELRVRQFEGEAEEAKAQARELEEELYGGTVTSPKELRNLAAKAEDYKRKADEAEEAGFSRLEEVERRQAEWAKMNEQIAEREAAVKGLSAEGEEMRQEIALRLQLAQAERDDARAAINGEWLALYDRLHRELRGSPIALVLGGVCQGCRVAIPTSLGSRVRTNKEVVRCDQCGRVLCSGS